MPVLTIKGLVTSAATISHLPVPNGFTVTGCENSAKESKEYVLQFPLASTTAPVLIDNIFYDFDKATLTPASTKSLDELVKVSLSIYDTDGLEGLYVPISQFRETSKDVASSAMSGSMNMNTSGYGNSLAQWGMQAVNNAYQKTSNAISKAIKKNKVKLKYGTFVYLVNGRENRN